MNEERLKKIQKVAEMRQGNLTVILENVVDLHNVGAIMRSCDAVGVREIFVLYTDENIAKETIKLGKRTSAGTRKWLDIHYYTDADLCFGAVKKNYKNIFATHLAEDSVSLYELDLSDSVALLFGGEHLGITEKSLAFCDGNFLIPQVGMVPSLNVSVAAAVSLFEAARQRNLKNLYEKNTTISDEIKKQTLDTYLLRCETKDRRRETQKINI